MEDEIIFLCKFLDNLCCYKIWKMWNLNEVVYSDFFFSMERVESFFIEESFIRWLRLNLIVISSVVFICFCYDEGSILFY